MAASPSLADIDALFRNVEPGALPGVSVYDAIRTMALRFPDKTAVIDLADADVDATPETISYRALHAMLVRSANCLRAHGVEDGDRIVYLAPNSLAGLVGFWTAQLLGVVVPVNPFLDVDTLAEIARATGARAIMSAGTGSGCGSFSLAAKLKAQVPAIALHVVLGGGGDGGSLDLLELARGFEEEAYLGRQPGLDDPAAYFPTGGTTGAPKVARLSHRNLLAGAYSSAVASSLDHDHVVPLALPLFHVGGGVVASTRTLMLGQTLVVLTAGGFRTPGLVDNFWALAEKYGFTQFISVPTIFSDLLKTYTGGGTPIRIFVAGASKLPTSLCESYQLLFGHGIHEGYGMTETSGFCAVNPTALPPRPGSGGIVAPLYRVRIVELDGEGGYVRECAVGETGNIAVAGPGVFQGYVDSRQDAGKFISGMDGPEWIDAGDLGHFDTQGYLWITGREKDLIIRGGHNIDPTPIEETLLRHPDVVDAAVVGMPDPRVGELPIAFVQLAQDVALDEDGIRAFCLDRLPERAGTPVRIFALDALPRTAMRKIFKPELRRLATACAVETALASLPGASDLAWQVLCDAKGCLSVDIGPAGAAQVLQEQVVERLGPLNLTISFCGTI